MESPHLKTSKDQCWLVTAASIRQTRK